MSLDWRVLIRRFPPKVDVGRAVWCLGLWDNPVFWPYLQLGMARYNGRGRGAKQIYMYIYIYILSEGVGFCEGGEGCVYPVL